MSKKRPVTININESITVLPDDIFRSKVVKSGNGAVVKAYKKHINKNVVVIIEEEGSVNGFTAKDRKKQREWLD